MPTTRLAAALVAATALLLLSATSALAGYKPYSVVVSNADGSTPATLSAGTQGTVKATYTNLNSQQQLGSSDLAVPAGLRVVSAAVAPQGSASVAGNVVRLRNLNLAPGAAATVTIGLVPDCTPATYYWTAPLTKQANNFNGPPGNDLNLDLGASDLRTVVTGACALRFLAQPANARVTQTITSAPYDPTAAPVTVELVGGGGERIPTTGLPVTVAIGSNPGGGTLAGTKTAETSAGVATFSSLSIDAAGAGYTLYATSPGASPTTSTPFSIADVAVVCAEDVDCSGSLSLKQTDQSLGGRSSVDVTAVEGPADDVDAGFLTISLRDGGPLDCSGYTELTAATDVVVVDYTALDRAKTVVATIDKRVMNAVSNNGAAFLESCFGAPFTFPTKPGTPLEVNAAYVPGPYPAPEYKGLLPDCGGSAQLDDPGAPGVSGALVGDAGPPCVVKRNKTGSGNGVITTVWPSGRSVGFGDPRGRY